VNERGLLENCHEGGGRIPSQEDNLNDVLIIIDILIIRPAGLASCLIGLAASVIALPFALPSHSTDKVYKALIEEPFSYTFKEKNAGIQNHLTFFTRQSLKMDHDEDQFFLLVFKKYNNPYSYNN